MAQEIIDIGQIPNDKTGDPIRDAMDKVNKNFTELYNTAVIATSLTVGNTTSPANVFVTPGNINVGNTSSYSYINSTAVVTNSVTASKIVGVENEPVVIVTTDDNHIFFRTYGDEENQNRMVIASNGNVGIGNNDPENNLRVEGTFGAYSVTIGNSYISSNISYNSNRVKFVFSGVANSTDHVGSVPAANIVSDEQLYANLVNYVRVDGLADNVVKLRANVATYIDANSGLISNSSGVFVEANTLSGLIANSSGLHIDANAFSVNSAKYVVANNGIVSNSAGVWVRQGTGTVVNATGVHVNAAYIGTLHSGNTYWVGATAAEYVVNSTHLTDNLARYVEIAGLAGNVAKLTSNNATYAYGKIESKLGVNTSVYVNVDSSNNGWVNTISVNARTGTFTNAYANQIYLDAGFGSQAPIYGVRAWGTFDGRVGYVAWWWWWWWWPIVVERGRGDYEVIFNTPMPDTNYAVIASADIDRVRWPWWYYPWPGFVDVYERSTTSVKIRVVGNWWLSSLFHYDSPRVSVAVIR